MQVSNIIQRAEIRAVITRADGTIEDLGVIDSYEKPPTEGKQDINGKDAE